MILLEIYATSKQQIFNFKLGYNIFRWNNYIIYTGMVEAYYPYQIFKTENFNMHGNILHTTLVYV